MEITIKDIQNNLKSLPEELLGNVNDYIDSLKEEYLKKNPQDWSKFLSVSDRESISMGVSDIENGRTLSHDEAKAIIKEYIAQKIK